MARLDPHSYADDAQPQADALDWHAQVDFAIRSLRCSATLTLHETVSSERPLDLDTRELRIESIVDQNDRELRWQLAPAEPILGSRLRVELRGGTSTIRIRYETSPAATALQWLEPAQTADGRQPFVYTQCQPIHTRSVVPLQDTPRTRLRFSAELVAPRDLTALMAAETVETRVDGDRRSTRFRMPQPIAPYLFAFVIGALHSRDLGPRCRVWAEPSVVDAAAWEFADTERLLETGERIFGAYDWQRYDVLVLPPSFPYGGMENPRLTFLTSAVLAGDRSLIAVIAHELAHSWTGNLISNANAEHFWLNEGWTTYAERRIVEAVWGPDVAALEWALGRRELDDDMRRFEREARPELTQLRTRLQGVDPDDAFSVVPYEKGALFLRALDQAVGRDRFDAFIRSYIEAFRFGALTTEQFLEFVEVQLGRSTLSQVDADAWMHQAWLPESAPIARSVRLEALEQLNGSLPTAERASEWTAIEWQLYIESLTDSASIQMLHELDQRFGLTHSRNYDVLVKWLTLSTKIGYQPALPRVEETLCTVGRLKYLRPLYGALLERAETRQLATTTFERCARRYHPISRAVVADLLARPAQ